MLDTFSRRVLEGLTPHGWSAAGGSAIAFKDYPTAVGIKRAHVYVAMGEARFFRAMIEGEYWSEGRNILEPWPLLLSTTVTDSELREKLHQFCAETDRTIGDSYAARLLRYDTAPGYCAG